MKYQAVLHIKERADSQPTERLFNGWMSGDALNVFGSLADTHCAMTSGQAIAYKCRVENRAWEWNTATKITQDGQPSDSTVTVTLKQDLIY
jgi:hypothetical protein